MLALAALADRRLLFATCCAIHTAEARGPLLLLLLPLLEGLQLAMVARKLNATMPHRLDLSHSHRLLWPPLHRLTLLLPSSQQPQCLLAFLELALLLLTLLLLPPAALAPVDVVLARSLPRAGPFAGWLASSLRSTACAVSIGTACGRAGTQVYSDRCLKASDMEAAARVAVVALRGPAVLFSDQQVQTNRALRFGRLQLLLRQGLALALRRRSGAGGMWHESFDLKFACASLA